MRRLRRGEDRFLYAAAHALLRVELSRLRPDVAPQAWRFALAARGRPRAVAPDGTPGPACSLSHSWPYVAVVVAPRGRLGIDVEHLPADWADIARTAFVPQECAALNASSDPEAHFLRLWTLKEAASKLLGCGLPLGFPATLATAPAHGPAGIRLHGRRLGLHCLVHPLAGAMLAVLGHPCCGEPVLRRANLCSALCP